MPHVSENTATITGPIGVGSRVKATPAARSREYSDAILELAARIKEQPSEGAKAGLERLQDDGSWLDVGPWIAKRELL